MYTDECDVFLLQLEVEKPDEMERKQAASRPTGSGIHEFSER
jgi:hypothetical protein